MQTMLVDGYTLKCKLCDEKFFSLGKAGAKKRYLDHVREKHPEKAQQAELLLKDA